MKKKRFFASVSSICHYQTTSNSIKKVNLSYVLHQVNSVFNYERGRPEIHHVALLVRTTIKSIVSILSLTSIRTTEKNLICPDWEGQVS